MRTKLVLLALVGVLLIPAVALAQDTGSVSGGVFDRTGNPVAGATVRISGEPMPVARTMVTPDTGVYTFTQLLPGNYTVMAEKSGVGKITRPVVVAVGRDTQVDFLLGAVTEAVTVVAVSPDVNVKSTEVSFNYTKDFIQDLPLDRSYLGLLQLVPGIADNGGFAPNGGGSRQDNTYLIDGVNITNPLFGYLGTEVNELDVAEVNAKRGAITAEFGRSAGFVANAVTRSGTNRFAGNYRFEAIPNEWIVITDDSKNLRSPTDRWVNAFSVGGPVSKDRLFFYGSGRIFRSRSVRNPHPTFGPIPDRRERTEELFGKITAPIGSEHFINVGYRHRPTTIDNAGIGSSESPTVATDNEGTNRVVSLNYDWFLDSRTTVSVKYLHMDEQSESVAVTDLGFQPTFDVNNLAAMGRYTASGITVGGASLRLNRQNYYRNEIKASITRFLDLGGMSHTLKGGFGYDEGVEDLTRKSNGWGDISHVTVSGQPRIRANYYPEQPTQLSRGRTYSIFVQDDIAVTARLTVNAGLLLNRDDFIQDLPGVLPDPSLNIRSGTFLDFGFGEEIQPRLGFNYQLRKGQGDKVYANWGRYFGLDQKSSARALASGRLFTENSDFNPTTGALISRAPQANTTAKRIDPAIKSPYMDEFVVGYATPLPDSWSLDAFFLYRDVDRFIEDIPSILPFSTFVYQNDFVADRKYKTFALELNRNLRDRWAMNVSYAWSKLYGNYDQDYSGGLTGAAVFNTSSLINDGPGSFAADTFRQNGVLSQDRPHVFKVLATWMPQWVDNFTLGLFVRSQSGTPWEARGLPWGSSATYLRLLEPAGTNRLPMWTNVDLLLKYAVRLDSRRTFRIEGRILNLFNQETVRLVDNRKFLNPRNLTVVGTPPADCLACWTDAFTAAQPTTQLNANFGKPTAYAQPMRFLLSLLFDF